MTIENHKLEEIMMHLASLSGLTMPGKLSLAVVELKYAIIEKFKKVKEAKKNTMEAVAEKEEDGSFKTIKSGEYYTYVFPSPEIEQKCKAALLEIDNASSEYNFFDPKITKEDIVKLNCNPAQAEALLLFVK